MRRVTDVFSEQLEAWRTYTATPWARVRYAVVAEVLRRQVADLSDGRGLRVLDVGGGDGRDALPLALAGHDVTVVDPSGPWLAEARRRAAAAGAVLRTVEGGLDELDALLAAGDLAGGFDLVLCHFVLRYRAAPGADGGDLAVLARLLRPGGRLSLVDVNPAGRVLRALTTRGPAAARDELAAERAVVETFATEARKVEVEDVLAGAAALDLRLVGRFGNRVASDLLVDDAAKHDPAFFADLLALELELCDREPFHRVGFAWQLVLER